MNKAFFILGLLLSIGLSIFAQPYTYDSSFQPYFDIRTNSPNAGLINGVWENPKNGKLFVVGDFDIGGGVPFHGNFTQTNRYGNYVSNFSASLMGGNSRSSVYPINDTLYALIASGLYLQTDTFGSILFNNFYNNYWRTVSCKTGYSPFFFKDGSALIPNGLGNPGSCQIYSYNDTFPHQYIVKVTNQGLYDSTFKVYPNKEPSGFVPYDSNRILVFGKPYLFTHYNGKRINGLCRIFYDGTLDTTFQSPLKDTAVATGLSLELIDIDGSIFIGGRFFLKNDTSKTRTLVKLKPNGEIDSSFTNFFDIYYSQNPFKGGVVRAIEKTPDGGYLVGGIFDRYQGLAKNHIVKVDSNGVLEPQYFNSLGPDSSATFHSNAQPPNIRGITKSKFGGYYVYGDFLKWDGQPSQPIVRIHDLLTGVESQKLKAESLELYPNPSNGMVNISTTKPIRSVRIYNLQGQLKRLVMLSGVEAKSSQFKLPAQTGMYIIQVEDEKGNVFTKKIVKNNY